jgi:hypothetical protein
VAEIRNIQNILGGKYEGKRKLLRRTAKWEDDIKN